MVLVSVITLICFFQLCPIPFLAAVTLVLLEQVDIPAAG